MKCNEAIEHFLKLDRYEKPAVKVRIHIFLCKDCRRETRLVAESLIALQTGSSFKLESGISNNIMEAIGAEQCPQRRDVSSFKWLFVWVLILASIIAVPYNKQLGFLRMHFGVNFELPFVIVMGLAITLYSVIYIATHVEEIKNSVSFYDKK